MNRPNCHSEVAAATEESLFILVSNEEGGILRRARKGRGAQDARRAPQNDRRRRVWRFALLIVFAAAWITSAVPLFAQAPVQTTDRASQIGKQLMCTCGCGDTAGTCSHPGAAFSGPCDVAKAKLKEVNERVGRGESNGTILQAFVQEYGESALAAPPARGLNWFAYTFPFVMFGIGLGLVVMIIRVWRHRPLVPASGPAVSAEMLEHARRQIERDVQDD